MTYHLFYYVVVFLLHFFSADGEDCWWTGCQATTWGVRGCAQYNRQEKERRSCEGGHEFNCCATAIVTTEPTPATTSDQSCWWTGCQPTTWGVRGCAQYDRYEEDRRNCDGGHEFNCCPGSPPTIKPVEESCWWTGCQPFTWGVRGCDQYKRVEEGRRTCDGGEEFNCCPKGMSPVVTEEPDESEDSGTELCWWTSCLVTNATTYACPNGLRLRSSYDCSAGAVTLECCGIVKKPKRTNISQTSGTTFEELVKTLFMEQNGLSIAPDKVRCDTIDPGKHHMLKIKDEAIRICDLCPKLPQKHIANMFLDRVPSSTQNNFAYHECFGLCFEDKKCMAFSFDRKHSNCYTFDSTAGGFVEESDWTTVLMTQPTGVVRDWSYTRHTRILGYLKKSSTQSNFLHCLADCDATDNCNYVSYSTSARNCSLFAEESDVKYVDLLYGHLSGVRVSYTALSRPVDERFILEGEDLSVGSLKPVDDKKCGHLRDAKHGAIFSQSCLVSGSAVLGCDQATGCKRCYYPEKTDSFEKLSICPDSEFERLNVAKSTILANLQKCYDDTSCIGVGYEIDKAEVSTINAKTFATEDFDTKYMLKVPPKDSRFYLKDMDLVSNADLSQISGGDFKTISNQNFDQCIATFKKSSVYSVASYSFKSQTCKLATEKSSFRRTASEQSFVAFKRPSILSFSLNYLRIPGFQITSGAPRAVTDHCTSNCVETCSKQCSNEHSDWCFYFSIEFKSAGAKCTFYDDDTDFNFNSQENSLIFSRISAMDFTLDSFDKLDAFQSSDVYDCFDDENQQTQSSLSLYEQQSNTEVSTHLRGRRGFFDFFKKIGKSIVDGVKKVGRAIADTAKGVVKTVGNLVKGDLKGAKDSFLKIPVVDLAKNTGELAGAVFTGDWDKAKKKGKQVLESDAFELVTTVALPGAGKLITSGAKAAVTTIGQVGKQGAKTIAKGGKGKIDDAAKGGRNVKNGEKPKDKPDKPDKKKEDEKIDKERGEKCDKKRPKRSSAPATTASSSNPGQCKKKSKVKCARPNMPVREVIAETLNDCTNRDEGYTCRYECKPGYKERKITATCKDVNGRGVWQPAPQCDLVACSAGNTPMITVETPITAKHGVPALGDYIVAYINEFDKKRRLPKWSVALHQSDQYETISFNAAKEVDRRSKSFTLYPCTQLTGHQTKNADYAGRGDKWQKGHLTPFDAVRWSQKARHCTHVYINAAPQEKFTNNSPWGSLEAHVNCFSKRYRTMVATGICDSTNGEKIGSNIEVPKCFWKMACYRDENSHHQVVAFYAPNDKPKDKDARRKEVLVPLSQEELESKTGMNFAEVWTKPALTINSGRPTPIATGGAGVWMPVNIFLCKDAKKLSNLEKDAWQKAFDDTMAELKRGNNVPETGPVNSVNNNLNDNSDKKKKIKGKRAATLDRGCHPSEFKNALDLIGFFDAKSDYSNETEDENEDGTTGGGDEGDGSVKVDVQKCGKRIIGYYTSWGEKTIAGRELQRLTHVIYAFLEVHSDGRISVGSADRKNAEDIDKETRKARQRLEDLMASASRYPHLKVMFAVGGWENSQYFSAIAASPGMRVTFIASIIRMIEEFGFDGVDVDWEYPVTGGANEGVPADKQNYVVMMKEIRIALDGLAGKMGRKDKFLISFAGAAGQWTLDPGYDLPGILQYADFANIMTYDYFGAWESKWGAYTGPPSPLFFGMPPGFSGKTNADWSVKYYTCKSKEPHKINMGVPFYGRYWKNVEGSVDGKDEMWRKAAAVNGKFEGGYVPWHEVKSKYLNNGAFQKKYHDKAKAPYAWNPAEKIFLGYEDQKSLEEKVKYAVDKNVGGLMIWALELDDDDLTLLDTVAKAPLCQKTDPKKVNHKCSPIDDKRWWTPEDGDDKAGLCGRSAPLYKGYYPVCDPDDPGYSCCGDAGYCGTGPKYCDCPTCKNYREDPKTILTEPIKPSIPVTWYLLNDPDGKRGRCGRKIPKINSVYPTCNPDDENSYCCSNGGYCGNTESHCKCNGCVDFKKDPRYQFGPKKWWTLEDGEDLGGQCGPKAPKVDGIYEAECEGSSNFHCCTPSGWCGSGPDFCDCKGCVNFRGKN